MRPSAAAIALVMVQHLDGFSGQIEDVRLGLTVLWRLAALYLAFISLRGVIRRKIRKGGKVSQRKPEKVTEVEPVAWAVGRASSWPSPSQATMNVPGYRVRLLQ